MTTEIDARTKSDIEILAQHQSLPPIEWHLNNLSQLLNHLVRLQAPDLFLIIQSINGLANEYQLFLNSYEKADRKQLLANLHTAAHALAGLIKSINLNQYGFECTANWNLWKQDKTNPIDFNQYVNQACGYLIAIHDFALGLAATCTITNPEPYKQLYKNLE